MKASACLRAFLLPAALLLPLLAHGQLGDARPRLGDLVGGAVATYCTLGDTHDIANAVEVFGRRRALRLPIPAQDTIPGQEVLPMPGVQSVRLGAAEIGIYSPAYPDQDSDTMASVLWARTNGKLDFHKVLKHESGSSVVRCRVGERDLAFVSTLNHAGNASDLYVFDDRGRLASTIRGRARFDVPLLRVDEAGGFTLFGTGLSIDGKPTWPHGYPARNDPRRAAFFVRLDASSASPNWKRSLKYALSAADDPSPAEEFFPRVFRLRPDGRVVAAPSSTQRMFYVKVAEESASGFQGGSDEYGIFTHDLMLPIFVRVLAEAGDPDFARRQWDALPDKMKAEIDLDLLIEFWRLKRAPQVGAAFTRDENCTRAAPAMRTGRIEPNR
jgi:hypothetical protein